MKTMHFLNRLVSLAIILLLAAPAPVFSQDTAGDARSSLYTREQLAQMLAPIALYPDTLLSQILMASTYPLEVVEADRWVKKNGGLKGDALDEALKDKEWDPSVKSLCHFGAILGVMSEKIAQTTKLGDAFLAQQEDVMNMVQELRSKAREAGNLASTKEQKVVVEKETIIIDSASPEVIYVPSYDPAYVYGPWWYPAYPPYYWWPGPVMIGSMVSFWPGIFVGISVASWCYFDWHNHYIHIDWSRTHRFHKHRGDRDGRDRWHHDSAHRRGVAYRDRTTARKFGQAPERSMDERRDRRGFPERRIMKDQTDDRQQLDKGRTRRDATERPARDRVRDRIDRSQRVPERDNAFSRGSDARQERMDSERGRSSRGNTDKGVREQGGRSGGSRDGGQRDGGRRR